jgi:hypothetical protein
MPVYYHLNAERLPLAFLFGPALCDCWVGFCFGALFFFFWAIFLFFITCIPSNSAMYSECFCRGYPKRTVHNVWRYLCQLLDSLRLLFLYCGRNVALRTFCCIAPLGYIFHLSFSFLLSDWRLKRHSFAIMVDLFDNLQFLAWTKYIPSSVRVHFPREH